MESFEPDAKRRKLRKGTRSCWDCKRRKVKCEFTRPTDEVCIACRRRGSQCISQEYPEQVSVQDDNNAEPLADRLLRVESLLSQLVAKVGPPDAAHAIEPEFLTPTPTVNSDPLSYGAQELTPAVSSPEQDTDVLTGCPLRISPGGDDRAISSSEGNSISRALSKALYAAWPSQQDLNLLSQVNYDSTIYLYLITTRPNIDLSQDGNDVIANLVAPPTPDMHPVVLAKKMFIIALFLQCFPQKTTIGFLEEPHVMMKRMADQAIKLVSTNEELTGSLESLECIIYEAHYHANIGNLRRSWLAWRRALMVGQLMGIDRPQMPHVRMLENDNDADPRFMWHAILYNNRFFSLMLGLPCSGLDEGPQFKKPGAVGTSWIQLETKHSQVVKRLLERRTGHLDDSLTQEIDAMLVDAAKCVPDDFWSLPKFDAPDETNFQALFWRTVQAMNQVKHYSLVNCLHLPYLLRNDSERKYEYSKIACLMASREILRRYNIYRRAKVILSCCRPLDFVALIAALSLAVAHLNTHRHQTSYAFLPHQRQSDIALLDQILETMDTVAKVNEDTMTHQSTCLLRRLMYIEDAAFQGQRFRTEHVQSTDDFTRSKDHCTRNQCSVLHIDIPYFGTIKISQEAGTGSTTTNSFENSVMNTPLSSSTASQPAFTASQMGSPAQLMAAQEMVNVVPDLVDDSHQVGTTSMDPLSSLSYAYPDLTATVDDWAFQGVDTAFFGSIMGQCGNMNCWSDCTPDTSINWLSND